MSINVDDATKAAQQYMGLTLMKNTLQQVVGSDGMEFEIIYQALLDYMIKNSDSVSAISGLLNYNFMGMANGFANAISDSMPRLSGQLGSNGTVVGMSYYPVCATICYEIVDEDNADNGRPYCKNGKMVDLKEGYYVAENGSIPFDGTKQELESIKSYLESGVYYA